MKLIRKLKDGSSLTVFVVSLLTVVSCGQDPSEPKLNLVQESKRHTSWKDYGGSQDQSRFVDLDQITKSNVNQLEVAWTYASGDENAYAFNPLVVDGVMYVQAKNNSLVAIDLGTGEELWVHEELQGLTRRGVNYWESEDQSDRRLIFARNNQLQAIDAGTGESILSFGINGLVDLREGLGRDPQTIRRVQSNNPGRIFENLILLGSSTGEGYFSTPGHLRAYNVVTGKLAWTFHTIPQPGEFGYETWPEDAYLYAGGVNAWGDISLDAERGIAYYPLGSPTYDYYGADRVGDNLFGNSLVALDARTGERLWHFQTVHHDLWDYDLTAAPQLITVEHEGKMVDAVAQASKQGFLFVFDRVTGEPLHPIEERPVPASEAPGEVSSATQPFPTGFPITARQIMTVDYLTNLFLTTEEIEAWEARINNGLKGLYTPLSVSQETISVPGAVGGTNWGNTASNPDAGILYVLNQDFPSFYKLELIEPVPESTNQNTDMPNAAALAAQIRRGQGEYTQYCEVCHGDDRLGGSAGPTLSGLAGSLGFNELKQIINTGQGRMPALEHIDDESIRDLLALITNGNPATAAYEAAVYPEGIDVPDGQYRTDYGLGHPYIMEPPWSTIMAIDLNTGTLLWKKPLGQDRDASAAGVEGTGVPRGVQRNGMIVTSNGLVFSTAKDGKVYAFDADNGDVLWNGVLPKGTEGLPSMYEFDGRQYLVVNATTGITSGRLSRESGIGATGPGGAGAYVVFALPISE